MNSDRTSLLEDGTSPIHAVAMEYSPPTNELKQTSDTVDNDLESGVRLSQPGTYESERELNKQEPFSEYEPIVSAPNRHLFHLPCLELSSYNYGVVSIVLQISSFGFFLGSFVDDPSSTGFAPQIAVVIVYNIIVSWLIVPFWQRYSIVNEDGTHVSCETNGCVYCNCCCILCNLCCCCGTQKRIELRNDNSTRYIPFSLYNVMYLIMDPGMKLNEQLPSNLEYFGFGRAYFLILSLNMRGNLNFYIFLNAMLKLLIASNDGFTISTALALISFILSILDLQVYLFSVLFGLLLCPISCLFGIIFCCPDCCSLLETVRARRDTCQFKILSSYWNYVKKY